ncbi:hypothetical protein HMPREF3180_02347 [Leptotrichia wadei]|jgi:hypothetical protein|uniref:Uncharacterized protein n=1 Tax=Leptotrichia wadei TaxID=157687 RepID=A0A133ZVF4_9FUSO|nr:hypothetical protein [Leptotrichia wadei]KXB59405.1 hypothetical protein HMPREF3180_02347 [Leptotrichia wadei]
MREDLKSETKKLEEKELSNIEKLFLNYKRKYKKIDLDWDNEVGKEIWYKDESEKSK